MNGKNNPNMYIIEIAKIQLKTLLKQKDKAKGFRQMAFCEAPRSIALLWGCAGKACLEVEVGFPHLLTQIGTPLCPLQVLAGGNSHFPKASCIGHFHDCERPLAPE